MKVFARWDPAKSGSKSKSAPRSKFRNGSSFGIGTPTKASRNNINVVRRARFYDELGGGITVPLFHPKRQQTFPEFGKRR